MKQKNLLTRMLLLFALVVGSVTSVWADEIQSNFTNKDAAVGDGELEWTATNTNSFETSGSARGVQSQKNTTAMVFTSNATQTAALGTITKVVVTASTNGSGRTISVTVGGNNFGTSQEVGNGSDYANTEYTFESSATGTIVVSINPGSKASSCWIKKIVVTYQTSSDPPSDATFAETTPSISFPATTTYSQTATTADGYTGTVTYEITANTAGATISGSTVTVTQGGSVTVKATAPAIEGSFAASTASYTLTVTDTRTDNGLAFAEASQTVYIGETLTAPTLTNPNNLSVTYSCDNTDVATVDANGNVTGVAAGTATITASFAGDNNYKAGSVSYTVTVKKAPGVAVDGVFDFTYADEIDYGTGLEPSGSNITEAKIFTAGNVTLTPEPTKSNAYWRWWTDGTLRLYTDTKMTIAVSEGYIISKIEFVGTQNLEDVTVSTGVLTPSQASNAKAATWIGNAQSVILTRSDANPFYSTITVTYAPSATLTLASACTDGTNYFGTYSNESAFVVPEDLTVSAVSVSGGKLVVTDYNTGDIVKANTGVMVSSATAGEHTVLLSSEEGTEISGNMLKGSGDAGITATEMAEADANCTYYRLTMHNGTQIGYWWGAEDGAAFALAANKAYLAVPTAEGAPALGLWVDGETTDIKSLTPALSQGEGVYYDLSGRRVAQPTKGLYIVNGKKVLVK